MLVRLLNGEIFQVESPEDLYSALELPSHHFIRLVASNEDESDENTPPVWNAVISIGWDPSLFVYLFVYMRMRACMHVVDREYIQLVRNDFLIFFYDEGIPLLAMVPSLEECEELVAKWHRESTPLEALIHADMDLDQLLFVCLEYTQQPVWALNTSKTFFVRDLFRAVKPYRTRAEILDVLRKWLAQAKDDIREIEEVLNATCV